MLAARSRIAARRTRWRSPAADRSPAAVVGRSGDAARHPALHAIGARRCALVPEQHRVHPPHQRPRQHRRGPADRVRSELPGAGPRRCLSRRAGGHAARSAPPPGDDQVQPGAHLDARERGRHRRRLSLRLRHGGSGRLPVRRAHLPDLEPVPHDRRISSRASRGCCASSTRSASTRCRRASS